MADADLLMDVLRLARIEGALDGDGLTAFGRALEERAGLILAEQLRALEEQLRVLEEQRSILEQENAWRREAMAGLEEGVRSLEKENAHRAEAMATLEDSVHSLEQQVEHLRGEHQKSTDAHDTLLAHHREVFRRVVAELMAASAVRFPGLRGVRQRLVALAELMRREAE